MKTNTSLSLDRLKEVLEYDPYSGQFFWKLATGEKKLAGSVDNKGYMRISVDKVRYKAHRLAWFYSYGEWPVYQIDHINGCKLDNRLDNLRDVPQTINMYNKKKAHRHNKSGILGVHKTNRGTFYAKIKVGEKLVHLGTFHTGEEASTAYEQAKEKLLQTIQ